MKGAFILLGATLVAGCHVENDLSVSILQMQAITHDGNCMVQVASGANVLGRSRGLLDVALAPLVGRGYVVAPVVRNNLPGSTMSDDVEHNSIVVQGVNVSLELPSGTAGRLTPEQKEFFYAAAAGRIDPLGTAAFLAEIVKADTAQALAGAVPAGGYLTLTAHISPVYVRSGDQIVGGAFDFPLDLCLDCLRANYGACPLPKGTVVNELGCFPEQDDVATCCSDPSGALLCGAQAPIAM